MPLKLGSLFDGIGVFPLAAVNCGITPAWASEIEKAPVSITRRHFPEMEHLGGYHETKRCGIGASGYPHLRFSLSEPVYGRGQGGTGREKVRPVLRGHSYYQRNEGCNQWHISSFRCLGERHGSFFIGRPDGF